MNVDGLDVERGMLARGARHDEADRRRVLVLKVVRALDRHEHREIHGQPFVLAHDAVLPEELDRLVARAVNADLAVLDDAEAVLEADDAAVVEAEEIAEQAARAGVAVERAREAMRHAECT